MFSYQLPNGQPHLKVTLNDDDKIVYDTPLREQIHSTVIDILDDPRWSTHFKKIVDFGCGNMRLFKLLRRLNYVENILNIDVDEPTLLKKKSRIDPLLSDNLQERKIPLHAEVLKGSITDAVENLRQTDGVVVVDVIQYLSPEQLEKTVKNIFGFMQPKLAIVSTPNHEFNIIWNDLTENGYRSPHHKFEWNRNEFKNWARKICSFDQYPNYSFAILGVGPAPPDKKKLGSATQLAIFARNDVLERDLTKPIKDDLEAENNPELQYKMIHTVDFPFRKDERTKQEKIESEIMDYLSHAHKVERYYNRERDVYQIPFGPLLEYARDIDASNEDVLLTLKAKQFLVENEFIVVTQEYIDEHFSCRFSDDMYDGYDDEDDFLDFEPHRGNDFEDLEDRLSIACSINDNDNDEEENWD